MKNAYVQSAQDARLGLPWRHWLHNNVVNTRCHFPLQEVFFFFFFLFSSAPHIKNAYHPEKRLQCKRSCWSPIPVYGATPIKKLRKFPLLSFYLTPIAATSNYHLSPYGFAGSANTNAIRRPEERGICENDCILQNKMTSLVSKKRKAGCWTNQLSDDQYPWPEKF